MIMSPRTRKLALVGHVAFSVGWLGAVAVFLGLAVIGVTSQSAATARGAYLVMEPAAGYVLAPLAFASLLTGVVQSVGTTWGLFRHYWVLFKLLITVLVTLILLAYLETFAHLADAAEPGSGLEFTRSASPAVHAALALLALLATLVLAVFKPRGITSYGQRKQQTQRGARANANLNG